MESDESYSKKSSHIYEASPQENGKSFWMLNSDIYNMQNSQQTTFDLIMQTCDV